MALQPPRRAPAVVPITERREPASSPSSSASSSSVVASGSKSFDAGGGVTSSRSNSRTMAGAPAAAVGITSPPRTIAELIGGLQEKWPISASNAITPSAPPSALPTAAAAGNRHTGGQRNDAWSTNSHVATRTTMTAAGTMPSAGVQAPPPTTTLSRTEEMERRLANVEQLMHQFSPGLAAHPSPAHSLADYPGRPQQWAGPGVPSPSFSPAAPHPFAFTDLAPLPSKRPLVSVDLPTSPSNTISLLTADQYARDVLIQARSPMANLQRGPKRFLPASSPPAARRAVLPANMAELEIERKLAALIAISPAAHEYPAPQWTNTVVVSPPRPGAAATKSRSSATELPPSSATRAATAAVSHDEIQISIEPPPSQRAAVSPRAPLAGAHTPRSSSSAATSTCSTPRGEERLADGKTLTQFIEALEDANLIGSASSSSTASSALSAEQPAGVGSAAEILELFVDVGLDPTEVSLSDLTQMQQHVSLLGAFATPKHLVQALSLLHTEHTADEIRERCREEGLGPKVERYLVEAAQRGASATPSPTVSPRATRVAEGPATPVVKQSPKATTKSPNATKAKRSLLSPKPAATGAATAATPTDDSFTKLAPPSPTPRRTPKQQQVQSPPLKKTTPTVGGTQKKSLAERAEKKRELQERLAKVKASAKSAMALASPKGRANTQTTTTTTTPKTTTTSPTKTKSPSPKQSDPVQTEATTANPWIHRVKKTEQAKSATAPVVTAAAAPVPAAAKATAMADDDASTPTTPTADASPVTLTESEPQAEEPPAAVEVANEPSIPEEEEEAEAHTEHAASATPAAAADEEEGPTAASPARLVIPEEAIQPSACETLVPDASSSFSAAAASSAAAPSVIVIHAPQPSVEVPWLDDDAAPLHPVKILAADSPRHGRARLLRPEPISHPVTPTRSPSHSRNHSRSRNPPKSPHSIQIPSRSPRSLLLPDSDGGSGGGSAGGPGSARSPRSKLKVGRWREASPAMEEDDGDAAIAIEGDLAAREARSHHRARSMSDATTLAPTALPPLEEQPQPAASAPGLSPTTPKSMLHALAAAPLDELFAAAETKEELDPSPDRACSEADLPDEFIDIDATAGAVDLNDTGVEEDFYSDAPPRKLVLTSTVVAFEYVSPEFDISDYDHLTPGELAGGFEPTDDCLFVIGDDDIAAYMCSVWSQAFLDSGAEKFTGLGFTLDAVVDTVAFTSGNHSRSQSMSRNSASGSSSRPGRRLADVRESSHGSRGVSGEPSKAGPASRWEGLTAHVHVDGREDLDRGGASPAAPMMMVPLVVTKEPVREEDEDNLPESPKVVPMAGQHAHDSAMDPHATPTAGAQEDQKEMVELAPISDPSSPPAAAADQTPKAVHKCCAIM